MTIFFTFSPTSNHLRPLQVENSRLVVDEDDYGKIRTDRVNPYNADRFQPVLLVDQMTDIGNEMSD